MEPEAKYTYVGIAVLGLVGLMALSALWLAGILERGRLDHFSIYFKDHSLAGLQIDSEVTMRGIRIGTVESITIPPHDGNVVTVVIKVNQAAPIQTDSRAVIQRNVLTGLSAIDILPGKKGSPLLHDAPSGERYPVIAEGRAGFDQILDAVPELMTNFSGLIENASSILSQENRQAFTNALANFEQMTSSISGSLEKVDTLLRHLDVLANNLSRFTANLDSRSEDVTKALVSSAEALSLEAVNISQSVARTAQSFGQTLQRFEDPATLIMRPAETEFGPGEVRR
jgi:phospholipid/cholesterol/gamma-HCH transport system substrate-binding protein